MSWFNLLLNNKLIEAYYTSPPSLVRLRLHEIRLHQDGPNLNIRLDLNDYPDKPPLKWVSNHYNTAQINFTLIGIENFSMVGWSLDNVGDLNFLQQAVGIECKFIGAHMHFCCIASHIVVDKLSGYFRPMQ